MRQFRKQNGDGENDSKDKQREHDLFLARLSAGRQTYIWCGRLRRHRRFPRDRWD